MKTVESLKAENAKNLSFADRVRQLEEEVRELSVQLDKSNCDKIDLINQKQKDLDDYREKEEAQDAEVGNEWLLQNVAGEWGPKCTNG